MKILALIPARYNSTRLSNKLLKTINKKTIIQRTYLQSLKSKYITTSFVFTDSDVIKKNIEQIGGNVLIVKDKCSNGTERLISGLKKFQETFKDYDIIVNVQGDEPFINPEHIDSAIESFLIAKEKNHLCVCSTLHYIIDTNEKLEDTSIVKLVVSKNNNILYGSRNCIPSNKKKIHDIHNFNYYGHIGLFVFDKKFLLQHKFKTTKLQKEEDLEWLNILENGYNIVTTLVTNYEIGINTMKDYNFLLNKYSNNI